MKKLLGTTAILAALAITTGPTAAANLQVNVGGFLDFQAGWVDDDLVGETGGGATLDDANQLNFNTDTEVHFTVEGVADNGLEYGAVIELEADVDNTDIQQNGGLNADKAYLFTQGAWGRLEAGDNTDAAEALSVNSATFASATGGVDGDFYRYAISPGPGVGGTIVRPDLLFAHEGADATPGGGSLTGISDEDATKVTYYSPRIAGFQAGLSYIPNTDAVGFTAPTGVTGYKNAVAGGVNFTTQLGMAAVKLAVAGEAGEAKNGIENDVAMWDAGANVSFAGFTVGGSYGDYGDSLETVGFADSDANYWDAGVGYAWSAFSTSATYFSSKHDFTGGSNEFNNLVIGADYKVAPGLVPYAEVSLFDFDTVAGSNDGTVVIVGSQLTF